MNENKTDQRTTKIVVTNNYKNYISSKNAVWMHIAESILLKAAEETESTLKMFKR